MMRLIEDHKIEPAGWNRGYTRIAIAEHHDVANDNLLLSVRVPEVGATDLIRALHAWRFTIADECSARLRDLKFAECMGDLITDDSRRGYDEHSLASQHVGKQNGDQRLSDAGRQDELRRFLRSASVRCHGMQGTSLRFAKAGCTEVELIGTEFHQ